METYKIIRHYVNGRAKTIKTGQTLEQVQKHCNDPSSRKPFKWFDGYTKER